MEFQDKLRMYREQAGVTAKDFADQIGIKYTTYMGYENQGREPKYEVLRKIADALHISIDDLMEHTPDKTEYWLSKFPTVPLFADMVGDNIVISTMKDGRKGVDLVKLSKDEFATIMERNDNDTKKALLLNYERLFRLLTIESFLDRAVWGDPDRL